MIRLHARTESRWDADPFVARVTRETGLEESDLLRHVWLAGATTPPHPQGFRAILARKDDVPGTENCIQIPPHLDYLDDGDVIRFVPRTGDLWTLYRRSSRFNSMLLTERCNSNCVMCSQPPKDQDDSHLVDIYLQAIELFDVDTESLGITGGEPTLLGQRLCHLLKKCKERLPRTAIHMLSNGRLYRYLSLAQATAAVEHPDLMIGIPLYSDIAGRHDFVVQARGAFDDTIRGIVNLLRCGVPVEIRVVLHKLTIDGLSRLASFIARNLPNVQHVALMGLEMMGYTKMNLAHLWIDPHDYQPELLAAVRTLDRSGVRVSIYNHQLCLLPTELWSFSRQSISDWKNEYLETCNQCAVKNRCGGFFSSARTRFSDHIRRIASHEAACEVGSGREGTRVC